MNQVIFRELGLLPYKQAWELQEELFAGIIAVKRHNKYHPEEIRKSADYLLFCEHPPVYTLGKSGHLSNLLLEEEKLGTLGIEYYKINRGGDITFHGPGQLVAYPILDLDHFFRDISRYMRTLEEVIIRSLREFGIEAGRLKGATGVWLDPDDPLKARKICAMGVRSSRWVTMHGWALNVHTDLDYFNHIIPCGIADKSVTSMEKELGVRPDMKAVKDSLKKHFEEQFRCRLLEEKAEDEKRH